MIVFLSSLLFSILNTDTNQYLWKYFILFQNKKNSVWFIVKKQVIINNGIVYFM